MSDVERFKMVAVPVAYLRWLERMAAVVVAVYVVGHQDPRVHRGGVVTCELEECNRCGSVLCDGDPCQLFGRAGAHCAVPVVDDPDWVRGRPVPKGAA